MIDYTEPFYVENITNSNENLSIVRLTNNTPTITIECSSDKITWTTLCTTSTTAFTRTITPGEKLYMRASANKLGYNSYADGNNFRGVSKVGGNMMSLLYGSNFTGQETTFPDNSGFVFVRAFQGNTNLQTAEDLILPAMTLSTDCYHDMFTECMNLTHAPTLPAPILVNYCYTGMFGYCSSLQYIKCLAEDISAQDCLGVWVRNTPTTGGTFVKHPGVTWPRDNNSGIPTGWTVIEEPYEEGTRDFSQIEAIHIPEGDVVQITDANNNVIWSKTQVLDKTEPFYVENITDSDETVSFKKHNINSPSITIEYSTDKTTWSTLGTTDITDLTYTLHPGDKLYLRATADSWGAGDSTYYNNITGVSKVGGNIMSLLYGSNFTGQETTFPAGAVRVFQNLFYQNTNLQDASSLILPATTLVTHCYSYMFYGCTNLISAPIILPALTLVGNCYYYMFRGCSSLVSPPILPATTLAIYCYDAMFRDCTALTTAPALPATTLTEYCYYYMFYGCTGLKDTPYLPATICNTYSYGYMFQGCTSLKRARINRRSDSGNSSYYRMFYNVSNVTLFAYPGVTWTRSSYYIPTSFTIATL